jgi:hypothetical protein
MRTLRTRSLKFLLEKLILIAVRIAKYLVLRSSKLFRQCHMWNVCCESLCKIPSFAAVPLHCLTSVKSLQETESF